MRYEVGEVEVGVEQITKAAARAPSSDRTVAEKSVRLEVQKKHEPTRNSWRVHRTLELSNFLGGRSTAPLHNGPCNLHVAPELELHSVTFFSTCSVFVIVALLY